MSKKTFRGTLFAALAVALWSALCPARAQVIDLQTSREPVTLVDADWRFHAGDDPRWAQSGFDDSSWKLIQPDEEWTAQGYAEQNEMAWFRFRLRVPPRTASLVIQMPRIAKNYQLFANGQLVGQAGPMPPARPYPVEGAARVFTLPVQSTVGAQQIALALRLWEPPGLDAIRPSILQGRALVGEPSTVLRLFAMSKREALLARGSEYTQMLILLIVGTASLLLFLLTRQTFYLWFALDLLVQSGNLPIRVCSQHFAWGYFASTYLFILVDLLGNVAFALFLLGTLNLRRRREVFLPIGFALLAESGPLLLILFHLPGVWADGIYFAANTAMELVLLWFLLRGWRAGMVDAKLLLIPYGLNVLTSNTANLAYFLTDLRVPHAEKLLAGSTNLLEVPFAVSINDVGSVVSLLGMLAVLVYRFARTSREEQRLASALHAAHDIQHRLVPVDIPALGGLHTEIVYLAAEEVGGDFCQVLPRADGSILIAIGDVSGKGLQAAMLGTLAVGALRSMADEDIEPMAALERLNNVILRTGSEGFITCLCLKLSAHGVVTLANAGHLAPYLNGEEIEVSAGLPLGIVPDVLYEQSTLVLPATARLTLLSDGVVEARSRTGELFGFERTSQISQLSAAEIAAAAHSHGQEDDITIITLDWRLPVSELTALNV